ncbi:nitrate/nitrite transporter [Acidocella aminolytica]|uniref:Nitrate transporter n=1 Tax=Acidocella aminolytica 101 = DSM 11237 TaxID=1120923 RepID=A0A0D6PFU1_9PROT|nr:nitrate/nitrite transporter [Acidocella aminolytica]GAN80088.1 nitrate transporter [Acidocella aminolytica 101 = DSM 11237]GBQ43569.1 nitrate transporter [Acidocella aminolytica 101 = DSM 11237]SHE68054.1 MFS transporter, NNP family, nitrate/nitrite transporter [Acidocella aminolytica 101 = DSM 11237]
MSQALGKSFLKSGHFATLLAAFLYFDLSFMCWVLLGPLGIQIAKALNLDPAHKGLMVATPVLAGALLRLFTGTLADHIGGKKAGIFSQIVVILGLVAAWLFGVPGFAAILGLGVVLGMAGASFAIALPMAARWYPVEHKGKAMGLAGAGNFGTVLAALFAPGLGLVFGWTNVFGMAAGVMLVVLVLFIILAKDAPEQVAKKNLSYYLRVLGMKDTYWFMLFYGVTFGGFVGLASSLPIYFHTQYGLTPVQAGYSSAACVFVGSLFRPIGGWLADRVGGINVLAVLYALACAALVTVSFGLPNSASALGTFAIAMFALGTGNGAVFQLVPVRYVKEIGVVTGVVGCAGGLGGFFLASSLGFSKQWTGSYQDGFLIFAVVSLIAFIGINIVRNEWRMSFSRGYEEGSVRI